MCVSERVRLTFNDYIIILSIQILILELEGTSAEKRAQKIVK